jgi:tetratricopeptide (TPR) repeat protein
MGVVYAKYEMTDQAKTWFERAVEEEPYADAYLNLGHLEFMDEDYITALDYYDKAKDLAPGNPKVLLAESRAHHELENYGFAINYYDQLAETDPLLAEQFSYLQFRGQEYGRASDVALMKSLIVWGEEEE